jgi:hypothetical protein
MAAMSNVSSRRLCQLRDQPSEAPETVITLARWSSPSRMRAPARLTPSTPNRRDGPLLPSESSAVSDRCPALGRP